MSLSGPRTVAVRSLYETALFGQHCSRRGVPYPPRGYCAKKAAGKKVVQYRLPEADTETPHEVIIRPAPPPEKPTPEQAQIQAQIDTARDNNAAITAPDELKRPHRAIAGWLAEHKRQVQDRLPPIEIAIGSASNRNQTYFRK
jgi:hypothetical protein